VRAAIIAGGKGTRLSGFYPDLPKPMIPICGKPLLRHQVESLAAQGIRDITMIAGYKAEVIREYFGDGEALGARIDYIVEDEPLGTGGALSMLPREDTLVLLGDVYMDVDLGRFVQFHREKGAAVTLFVHPNSHPHDSDVVVVGGNAAVLAWKSKNDSDRGDVRNLVNAGLYVFDSDALPGGETGRRDLERDIIVPLIPSGKVFACRSTEYVKDMGTPERLKAVTQDSESGVTAARNLKNRQRAVFIFIADAEQMRQLPEAAESIRMLNHSPFLTIGVTNQPVIACGDVTFDGLEAIHARLDSLLGREGAYLDDLLFCSHKDLLFEAARQYNIDLPRSYMLGDSTVDAAAWQAPGCTTIGVGTGVTLADAVRRIFERENICG